MPGTKKEEQHSTSKNNLSQFCHIHVHDGSAKDLNSNGWLCPTGGGGYPRGHILPERL